MSLAHLKTMLNQTITLHPFEGRGQTNAPSYGTARAVKCRVEGVVKVTSAADRQDVVMATKVLTLGTESIPAESKVVLPDGTEGTVRGTNPTPARDGSPFLLEVMVV